MTDLQSYIKQLEKTISDLKDKLNKLEVEEGELINQHQNNKRNILVEIEKEVLNSNSTDNTNSNTSLLQNIKSDFTDYEILECLKQIYKL